MQNTIIGGLLVLLCITIILLFLTNCKIRNLTSSLSEINKIDTNKSIRILSCNKDIEKLIKEINILISEKKEIEYKYKEADLEIRQAIANISHDLRTPLTSIMGYIQLLEDDSISIKEKKQYISIIEKRAESLKVLISSFYDLSRLQANEYEINMEKINISVMLCNTIAAFYDEFEKNNLNPIIEIDENIQLVNGDKKATERIFNNLIQNILKHATGSLEIYLKKKDDFIISQFINEAKDLTEDDVKKLFDRFFTVDRMRTGRNTGLGLAITKTLVEKQGHKIWAEKKKNKIIINIKWNL
ncbi:HAMP domain-containing histidine kinase [Clostridium chauvoei]|uniref:histidine kinase n=1 Tax=Clostridium chauvoei TaxID=46867 RepID=A0ABD4REM3_9CLOT|nr:two-component sensor histidine kinase [Clostridium chauvoei]MBX7279693.1 HAMP domain-containing histidine kinase [Clostridium chauvoei]MBX7282062.1 HAMP domain-containing histidine kinase [Clostridium chauvoei]MBX7284584.1 HAMP domain-containing histidine kinase [Clostridium chauvoei]MBX7287878.1 HAMP domain-containing histidine kinase [Clostridium chauvoei]